MARAHRQLHSRLCRKHHRRGCGRHRTGGANIREASVQRFLPDMGYGHHAAHDGHSERAQPAEPVVRCRTTRQARLRHIASAWTEQCAGLRRRGLPAQCFSRLPDNFRRHRRQVPADMGQSPLASGRGACHHRNDGRYGCRTHKGDVCYGREPAAQRTQPASCRRNIRQIGVSSCAGYILARDGSDC